MNLYITGRLIGILKRQRVVVTIAHKFRLHFPVLWGIIMRRVKHRYLTYLVSLRAGHTEDIHQNLDGFDNQAWQKKQSLKSATKPGVVHGISNQRPSVDPNSLLDRINKNLAARDR